MVMVNVDQWLGTELHSHTSTSLHTAVTRRVFSLIIHLINYKYFNV